MLKFKIIPDIDKNPKILDLAQSLKGKICIWILFCLAFRLILFQFNDFVTYSQGYIWDKFLIIGCFIFLPKYKNWLLLAASLYWIIQHSFPAWPLPLIQRIAQQSKVDHFLVLCIILAVLSFVFFSFFLRKIKFNVAILITVLNMSLMFLTLENNQAPSRSLIAGISCIVANYMWYFILTLKDKNFSYWQLFSLMPFWTWLNMPLPKGWKYLKETEASTPVSIAVTQLKGLKLIYYAALLMVLQQCFDTFIYGRVTELSKALNLSITPLVVSLGIAVQNYGQTTQFSFLQNWLATISSFLYATLYLTMGTAAIVGVVRVCGWQVKRNVYRCFEATSISDFFNRYYYYFKEMLVEVFFYPTYFSFFKKQPYLRLFFATFMSAGIGNFLFHFNTDLNRIFQLGYWQALKSYQVYAFYCFVLSVGIFLSQWARMNNKYQHSIFWVRLRIIIFFMLMNVFVESNGATTIVQHLRFVLSLFGLKFYA